MKKEWVQIVEKLKKPTLYFGVEAEGDTSPNLKNHVGGKPYIQKGEEYPTCQRCKENLNFIFQLHVPKTDETGYDLFTFYYCFSCHPYKGEQGFCVRKYDNPDMIESKEPRTLEYIPYASFYFEAIWSLPDWNTLRKNHTDFYNALHENQKEDPWDVYDDIRSNILGVDGYENLSFYGGYPQFIQDAHLPTCSCCKKQMKLWTQMDSSEELDMLWSNTGCLYIFKCPDGNEKYKILIQSY